MHVEFGLANPAVFALLVDPRRTGSPATAAGLGVLQARIHRVALAGRLRVAERLAVELVHAAGVGAVLTLISMSAPGRDSALADAMYDTVARTILTEVPAPSDGDTVTAAVTLRAATPRLSMLTATERALLADWLDRVIG